MKILGELRCELGQDHALLKFAETDGELYVETVFVPAAARSAGHGSTLLARVLALADALEKPVRLKARPIGVSAPGALERLVRYYERFGFAAVGREAASVDMVRPARAGGG